MLELPTTNGLYPLHPEGGLPTTVPAFTLIEAVVSLAISSILFLGMTYFLSDSLTYSKGLLSIVRFQQEQQRVYYEFKNAFSLAERVLSPATLSGNVTTIVLENKTDSGLLPFTLVRFDSAGNNGNGSFLTDDFNLDALTGSAANTTSSKTLGNYSFDQKKNQIFIGTSSNTLCSTTSTPPVTTDCVLFGAQNNSYTYGTTAFAPFLSVPFISDIVLQGDYLKFLSPYEQREYSIRITNPTASEPLFSVQATYLSTPSFPYLYDTSTGSIQTLNFPTLFGAAALPFNPQSSSKNLKYSDFSFQQDLLAPSTATQELDQVSITVTDASNSSLTKSIIVPFVVGK